MICTPHGTTLFLLEGFISMLQIVSRRYTTRNTVIIVVASRATTIITVL